VLGTALKALENEFPRGTYKLLTKVGRYGPAAADFDYTPTTIRRSVRRSLQRLNTQYLDVVYLHDVEFVAPCVAPRAEGNHASALGAEAAAYGLLASEQQDASSNNDGRGRGQGESTGTVRTAGDDERILEAISELRALQSDGLIRQVGISGPFVSHHPPNPPTQTKTKQKKKKGLPLPALLRTALQVLTRTGRPLDIIQAYSHLTLQNSTLAPFAQALRARARVHHVLAASPLCMGLLVPPPSPPPAWHPAPEALREAVREAVRAVGYEQVVAVAVAWSVRLAAGTGTGTERMPVVVGMSCLREVHETIAAWRWANDEDKGRREELERKAALAQAVFERTGTAGWTWSSGNWV
jgi:D-arabinose 1-dehydrogenase